MLLPRLAPATILVCALALPARAQGVNYGTLQLTLKKKVHDTYLNMSAMEQQELFSSAYCECHVPFGVEGTLRDAPPGDLGTQPVEFWVGTACSDPVGTPGRDTRCAQVASHPIEDFHNKIVDIDVDVAKLLFPTSACGSVDAGQTDIWALVDLGANGTYDIVWHVGAIPYDTQAPIPPTSPRTAPSENGFKVSWTLNSTIAGIRGYQILCASTLDGSPIFAHPPSDPEYRTTRTLNTDITTSSCNPSTPPVTPDAGVAGAPADAATASPDAGDATLALFDALDPAYVCSSLAGGSSNEVSVDLSDTNNVKPLAANEMIAVKIVAMDNARNASALDAPAVGQPVAVRDAWEVYHDEGGSADGGFCFVATAAYGDYDHPYVRVLRRFRDQTLAGFGAGRGFIAWYYAHSPPWADFLRRHPAARAAAAAALLPVVALAAIWNELGPAGLVALVLVPLALRRWRRRRRLAMALGLVTLLGGAGMASAQRTWVDTDEPEHAGFVLPSSDWVFEIKLGPYYPDIDGEPGLSGKPYETVFGSGSSILPQIELDRFFFHPFGQLGIGLSVGYMSNTSHAFVEDPTTHMSTGVRAADETRFLMIPIALLAVYRLTELADRTYVPLVPYAKVGLSYYIWRMTKDDGSISEVAGKQGLGATLGWQASVGLSFRADRLDPDEAKSMETELGVEHVGFFAELTFADVSGLGMSNKLHVGDITWSAGLNFEF
jgi:hypothetical protein